METKYHTLQQVAADTVVGGVRHAIEVVLASEAVDRRPLLKLFVAVTPPLPPEAIRLVEANATMPYDWYPHPSCARPKATTGEIEKTPATIFEQATSYDVACAISNPTYPNTDTAVDQRIMDAVEAIKAALEQRAPATCSGDGISTRRGASQQRV